MTWISVDVESDGPIPSEFSMVCFGAVIVEPGLNRIFYAQTAPISTKWDPAALAISGYTREQHEGFPFFNRAMLDFKDWIDAKSIGNPIFVSDNPAYDWQFINYYFHTSSIAKNPFGFSARRIGDLYSGLVKDSRARWKQLRSPYEHTHRPVDDAKGNAQALLKMKEMGLKVNF